MNWREFPSLNALKAFAELAETRSYSRAGRRLNVTHSAVMQQVKLLENHLGLQLVYREGRGVALTQDGEQLAIDLTAGFERLMRGVERLGSYADTRPLKVTTSPAFAVKWLMPRLPDFHSRHPDIMLMLNPTGMTVDLNKGELDLALRFCRRENLPENAHILIDIDLLVVGSPKLINGGATPADMMHQPWLQEVGTNEVGDWFALHNVNVDRPLSITHMPGNLIMDAVRRGDGVTYTCRQWVEPELNSGVLLGLFPEKKSGAFYIATAPGPVRPPVQTFIAWLEKQTKIPTPH